MHKFKFMTLVTATFLLTSCGHSYTHDYLLAHPSVLQKEMMSCQNSTNYSYCNMVNQVGNQYSILANARHDDPEQFGKQILQSEYNMIAAQQAYLDALKNLENIKTKQASQADINAAQDTVNKNQEIYLDKKQIVNNLLAVVAGTTTDEL